MPRFPIPPFHYQWPWSSQEKGQFPHQELVKLWKPLRATKKILLKSRKILRTAQTTLSSLRVKGLNSYFDIYLGNREMYSRLSMAILWQHGLCLRQPLQQPLKVLSRKRNTSANPSSSSLNAVAHKSISGCWITNLPPQIPGHCPLPHLRQKYFRRGMSLLFLVWTSWGVLSSYRAALGSHASRPP